MPHVMPPFEQFLKDLARRLAGPLPGYEVHLRMAPSHRLTRESLAVAEGRGISAAVAILLYPRRDRFHLALIRRPESMVAHPGQVSLPGGRQEEGESLEETARRELREEVGVPGSILETVGALSPLYIPPTDFNVFPFVFACSTRPEFVCHPAEVEALIEVDLARLLDPAARGAGIREIRGEEVKVPYFRIKRHEVWGATAMILGEFAELSAEVLARS